jgi:hypothetical protein
MSNESNNLDKRQVARSAMAEKAYSETNVDIAESLAPLSGLNPSVPKAPIPDASIFAPSVKDVRVKIPGAEEALVSPPKASGITLLSMELIRQVV